MILTGLDRLLKQFPKLLAGKRVGLLCHPASINKKFFSAIEVLRAAHINVVRLFGPEHGMHGEAQDMEGVESCEVKSLYGKDLASLKPQKEWLEDLDILVVDLQDIGSRYYTFIYTMAFCMEVASLTQTQVVVLDRPNPINGHNLEGNLISPGYHSFVGAYNLPNRHGMTIGELAQFFKDDGKLNCELTIVPMKGWHRRRYFDELDYPWVAPSPNMPTVNTAVVYPGMCLLEGTEISEGRGTTLPFQTFGAPFIDPQKLVNRLNEFRLPSVKFRPIFFKPQFQKHAGTVCGGAQIHVTRRRSFLPLLTGMAVIKAIHDLWPKNFAWRVGAYEFVEDKPAIDLLMGGDAFREQIERGLTLKEMVAGFGEEIEKFKMIRKDYLLY